MLVVSWEAMNDAIPRLTAEESLSAYTIAVLASPPPDQETLTKRQKIIDEWRQLVIGKSKRVIEVTVAKLSNLLRDVFGEQIRE